MQLARQAAEPAVRRLSIGFVPAAEVRIFPRLLPMLRAEYPGLDLGFHSLTTAEQSEALVNGSIDLAFLRPPLGRPAPGLGNGDETSAWWWSCRRTIPWPPTSASRRRP